MDEKKQKEIVENLGIELLYYPDKRLFEKSTNVEEIDDEIKDVVQIMKKLMYKLEGVGMAAPQMNYHKRIFVIDMSDARNSPEVFINPKIIKYSDETQKKVEGCLSVPNIFEQVVRSKEVTIQYLDINGKEQEKVFTDYPAVCIQHEYDHLDGKIFIDRITRIRRNRAMKRYDKQKKVMM